MWHRLLAVVLQKCVLHMVVRTQADEIGVVLVSALRTVSCFANTPRETSILHYMVDIMTSRNACKQADSTGGVQQVGSKGVGYRGARTSAATFSLHAAGESLNNNRRTMTAIFVRMACLLEGALYRANEWGQHAAGVETRVRR